MNAKLFGLAFLAAIAAIVTIRSADGQIIYNATFNSQPLGPLATGSPPDLPKSIITDPGATVNLVASAGDLTDRPVVLHSVPDSLACAAFYNPSLLSSGDWRVSWDSLVLGAAVEDSLDQPNIQLGANAATVWGIKYVPSGQFSVEDAGGFHAVGSFSVGVSNHFDLHLDLDSGTYQFFVNNMNLIYGGLIVPSFDLVYFRSNGRTLVQLPDIAFDNVQVVAVPEPCMLSIASASGILLALRRKEERGC
jgi:hypothetical protein